MTGIERFVRQALPFAALLLLVGLVFHEAPQALFLSYDDTAYVTENPQVRAGLSLAGGRWAFTTFHASNYHPLTWLSHMLDCTLFGLNPAGHHLHNVLLHAANTLLLFLLCHTLTGWRGRSLAVAALWGVHPLHVESVLWIAERKDLLSTFFGLAAVACHLAFVRGRGRIWLAAMLGAGALSLLSKPMLVTLPLVLLLLDFWPLGRLPLAGGMTACRTIARLLAEKAPLAAVALVAGFTTLAAQQSGGAIKTLVTYPIGMRFANALGSLVLYLSRTFVPVGLSVFYPYATTDFSIGRVVGAAGLLLAISTAAWALRRSQPFLLTGWLWYLVTLAPVIGIVQVGDQASADRYTYLPLTGIFLVLVWGVDSTVGRRRLGRIGGAVLAVGCVLLAGALSVRRATDWHDNVRLFSSALAVNAKNGIAHHHLGVAIVAQGGSLEEALAHYREAVRLTPRDYFSYNFMGIALGRLGRRRESITAYQEAVRLNPNYAEAWFNLGLAHLGGRNLDAATAAVGKLKLRDPELAARLSMFITAMGNPTTR